MGRLDYSSKVAPKAFRVIEIELQDGASWTTRLYDPMSIAHNIEVITYRVLHSYCKKDHQCPDENCTCGIQFTLNMSTVKALYIGQKCEPDSKKLTILSTWQLLGKIYLDMEWNIRSEKAYLYGIVLPDYYMNRRAYRIVSNYVSWIGGYTVRSRPAAYDNPQEAWSDLQPDWKRYGVSVPSWNLGI